VKAERIKAKGYFVNFSSVSIFERDTRDTADTADTPDTRDTADTRDTPDTADTLTGFCHWDTILPGLPLLSLLHLIPVNPPP
jgi:hypothetical protein